MVPTYHGGRDLVKQAFTLRGMPSAAVEVTVSSITDSSWKQYEGTLRKWWHFCKENGFNPLTAPIPEVLQFLVREFERGASYGSINSHRSAIALILGPEIGQDSRIKRFCKGVANLRPPQPKYEATWDPKTVLDFLKGWGSNEDLTLEQLSQKLAALLALTTGHRIQTLQLIEIPNIQTAGNQIQIKIPARIKTSGPRRKQPILNIPFYLEDKRICVASTLEAYIKRTGNIRKNCKRLMISHKKPHKQVTTQTISRWIKNILQRSGIDTQTFTGYSTRHASTSAAKRSGVNWDTIHKSAGWSEKSNTFARFYNLPVVSNADSFAKAILET